MKRLMLLSLGDLRNISRDPLLLMVFMSPLLIALVMKFGLPLAAAAVRERLSFDLAAHYPFIISMAIPLVPMMIGTLIGFILLEDRDENLLEYFSVTPFAKSGYLLYRVTTPALLSFFFAFAMIGIIGLVPVNYLRLLPVLLMASLEAPMTALFLGVFAANRIEGLALSKVAGIFLMAPLPGYLVESRWQLAAGILPPYWVSRSFLASMEGGSHYGIYTIPGLLLHAGFIYLLLSRFKRI